MAYQHSINKYKLILKFFIILFFSSSISFLAIAGLGGGGMSRGKQMNINLLAGVNEGNGGIDGVGANAKFYNVNTLAINSLGHIYALDNVVIRKIVVSGSVGTVTTFAGGATGGNDGNGIYAQFGFLRGIVFNSSDEMFVACNYYCESIRKIDTSANVTNVTTTDPWNPGGLAISSSGIMYSVMDCAIYKITSGGVMTVFSGQPGNCGGVDGASTTAQFMWAEYGGALYFHNPTNELFYADRENRAIRKINASGTVTTFSGLIGADGAINGVSTTARFRGPTSITFDATLNAFFVTDAYAIRKITTSGTVSTFSGQLDYDNRRIADGTSATAMFDNVAGIVSNGLGTLYVTDSGKSIRKIDSAGNVVTIAGLMGGSYSTIDGNGSSARIAQIESVTKDSAGNIYILESPFSASIRKVTPKGVVTTYGDATCWTQDGHILFHSDGHIYYNCYDKTSIYKMNASGTITLFSGAEWDQGITDGVSTTAKFYSIRGLKEAPDGSIYVADECAVRKVTTSGTVSTIAGVPNSCGRTKGAIATARFEQISDLVIDTSGNIFVSETNWYGLISKITSTTASVFAGNYDQDGFANGTGTAARFGGYIPNLTIDPKGNIYVMDSNNHAVRKVTSVGVVTTPIGRKAGPVRYQEGLQLGPLPSSVNYDTELIHDRNKLYLVSPGGVFMAPAN